MRRARGQSIGEVINELIKKYNITSKFNEAHIASSWDKLMGPTVTKYTISIEVDNGILFIKLSNAALKQELSYSKERIREMLNNEVGENFITEVRIY